MHMLLTIMALSVLQINSLDAAARRGKQKDKKPAVVQQMVSEESDFGDFFSELAGIIADKVGMDTSPSGAGQAPHVVQYPFASDDTAASHSFFRATEQNPEALQNVKVAVFAASRGDLMTMQKLAREGICFNTPDPSDAKFSWTCAMYAADNNHVNLLDFLLRENSWGRSYANPESVDNFKQNILMIAASRPVCSAAVAKIVELCPELIEYCNPGLCEEGKLCKCCSENVDAFSPLSCAAKYGCYDAMHIMLGCNSSIEVIDAKNKNGKTALMIAAQYGYKEIVMRLALAKSNPFFSDTSGQTAYDYAHNAGHGELAASIKKYEELYHAQRYAVAAAAASSGEESDSDFSDSEDDMPELESLTGSED